MSLDLQAVRTALAAQIQTRLGSVVNVYSNAVDDPRPPSISITPNPAGYVTYWESMTSTGRAGMRVLLVVDAGARMVDAQIALDEYLGIGGARSIFDAIEFDRTLGGVVESCVMMRADGPSASSGLVATIPIEIYAKKG